MDINKFLEPFKMTPEQKVAVAAAMGTTENLTILDGFALSGEQVTAKLADLATAKTALEADFQAKLKKEEEFHSSVATWKTNAEKKTEELITAARQEAETKLAAHTAQIKKLATEYGIPDDAVATLLTAAPAPVTLSPVKDPVTGRFVSVEDYEKDGQAFIRLAPLIIRLEKQHGTLFGDQAPEIDWNVMIDAAKKDGIKLSEAYERHFKVPERRVEIAKIQYNKDIKEAEDRGATRAKSELLASNPALANQTTRPGHAGSPVLEAARAHTAAGAPPPATAANELRGVEAAVQAFREGKYASGKAV